MAHTRPKAHADSAANIGFEAKLWLAADKLRSNMDAAEYKHVVLGLIFLKYISDTFEEHRDKLVAGQGDYKGADPEDQDEYKAENVFWVPPGARWANLQNSAKQPTIGKIVDDAMVAIERDNPRLKGVLPKDYARPALDKHRLGELIDPIGTISLIGGPGAPTRRLEDKSPTEGTGPTSHRSVDLLSITHHQYLTLLQRYKELGTAGPTAGGSIPFDIDSHITEIDTGKIDADYMNSSFEKYLKDLQTGDAEAKEKTLAELHRSFASLSQEDQKLAEIFLHDIQRGDVEIDPTRTFRDYLTDYQAKAQNAEIEAIVLILGVDAQKLKALMNTSLTEATLNEYGRFDDLKATIDKQRAKANFEAKSGEKLSPAKVNIRAAALLRKFILEEGFELEGSG